MLVGDIQPARACSLAEDAVGGWLARRAPGGSELAPLGAPRRGPLELVARPGSVQSNIRLGGRTPSLGERRWPAMSLAQGVFGGMFSSRMVANLRERNGYAYTPYSRVRHARAGSSIVIAAEVATAATGAALVETLYELGRIATTGVTEEELELARHHAIGRFSFETATLPGLANTLATLAVNGVGLGYLAGYPEGVIAATKHDVDEAARHYLAPRELVTVVVGDPEAVAEQLLLVDEVTLRHQ